MYRALFYLPPISRAGWFSSSTIRQDQAGLFCLVLLDGYQFFTIAPYDFATIVAALNCGVRTIRFRANTTNTPSTLTLGESLHSLLSDLSGAFCLYFNRS